MKTKREISEEERRAARLAASEKRRELLNREKALDLIQRAEMLQRAGEIRTTDGAALSPKNTILVYMQAAAAGFAPSLVGGFRQWKSQGRTVRKGARGLLICFPKMGKNEETDADEVHGFGWGYVFDVSQTAAAGEIGEETEREERPETEEERRTETETEKRPETAAASVSASSTSVPAPSSSASVPAPSDDLAAVLAAIAAA